MNETQACEELEHNSELGTHHAIQDSLFLLKLDGQNIVRLLLTVL